MHNPQNNKLLVLNKLYLGQLTPINSDNILASNRNITTRTVKTLLGETLLPRYMHLISFLNFLYEELDP